MSALDLQPELVEQLDGIAQRVRTHHDEAMAAGHVFRKASEEMRAAVLLCGQALVEAKGLLPHGKWIPWVRQRCKMSVRTAQHYMQCAQPNTQGVAHLVRRFTYRLLERWAQRAPTIEAVLEWPIEEQRQALVKLEPAEKLCVALRERVALGVGNPTVPPATLAVKSTDTPG